MNKLAVILIVCNRVPYPLKDGGAMAMYAMIKGWHKAGKQVHLLCMNTPKHNVNKEELPLLFRQISGFEMVDVDTEIKAIPTLVNFVFSKKPQHATRFYNKSFEEKIAETINKIKPDIIQLESIYLQEYASTIRKHSKALLIQRLHNIEAEIWIRLANDTRGFLKKTYLHNLVKRIEKYEQFVWNDADALISISNKDEQAIIAIGCKTPICTIPYGIEVANKIARKNSSNNIIAYHLGAMDWQPNMDAMMWMRDKIIPEILKKTPDFQFQFGGRKMPENLKTEQRPFFFCKGEIENANSFIADKDILIVPLRSGSGIRIKTLEAMAEAKLVISTSVGIQGIEAQNKVHFLLANSPQEFADAIEWANANKADAMLIANNAQDLIINQYNENVLAERMSNFAERLA